MHLYDLRSPLGVAPAALTTTPQPQPALPDPPAATASHHLLLKAVGALADAQLPPSLVAAKAFAANRAQLRAKVASSGQVGIVTGQGPGRLAFACVWPRTLNHLVLHHVCRTLGMTLSSWSWTGQVP